MPVDWLRRKAGAALPDALTPADAPVPGRVERASPGIAALLEGVTEDGSHAVLDLGSASDSSLQVYGRFARRVRFADLLGTAVSSGGVAAALDQLPTQPDPPYDVVFAWDVLNWLTPEERSALVERLAGITAPNARLFLAVEESGGATGQPLQFALLDSARMRYEPSGPTRPAGPRLLPAEVERVLAPFRVTRAFTSKVGLREYVAMRRGRERL
jgi:hypothetical protein